MCKGVEEKYESRRKETHKIISMTIRKQEKKSSNRSPRSNVICNQDNGTFKDVSIWNNCLTWFKVMNSIKGIIIKLLCTR